MKKPKQQRRRQQKPRSQKQQSRRQTQPRPEDRTSGPGAEQHVRKDNLNEP